MTDFLKAPKFLESKDNSLIGKFIFSKIQKIL